MRIVSLAPSNTEILYALGLGEQIVVVTSYCYFPDDAKTKPRVGSWITSKPERIAKLVPEHHCDFLLSS